MGNGGQDLHQFYKKIIFGVVGFVVIILLILCYVAVLICYCIYTRPRYTSGQDETRNNYYVTDDGVQMETKEGSETGGSGACGSVACGSFRAGSSLVFSVSSLPSIPEYAHGRQSASGNQSNYSSGQHDIVVEDNAHNCGWAKLKCMKHYFHPLHMPLGTFSILVHVCVTVGP